MPATKTKRATNTVSRQRQPLDLEGVAEEIEALLSKYAPPLTVRRDAKGGFHLYSEKEIEVEGRKKKEMFFASMVPQKGYVGFYYMPIYTNPEQQALFKPELLSLLKGKSCFHVKRLDVELKKQIRQALADGFKLYRKRGWV